MRVTRESLIRIAKETAHERAYNNRDIIAAYLTGSLVSKQNPMLGGATDVDIVLVHTGKPGIAREIFKLTPDFHLDISHRAKSDFKSPRELRTDPLLGYEMYDPLLLFEREKFFEFVQAGLRAGFEFNSPALALGRSRKLLFEARKGWMDLMDLTNEKAESIQVRQFLRSVNHAANSVAEISGGPLSERRFLLDFPERAKAADRPNFTADLFNLTGASNIDASTLANWLVEWKTAFLAASENEKVDVRIHTARLNYYEKGIQALLEGETPLTALWPLIQTWTLCVSVLPASASKSWQTACEQLRLLGPGFEEHVSALDHYLDEIEVRLDEIANLNGLETSTSL